MTGAPVIPTARLTLRPHRMSDFEPFAAFFASDAAAGVGGPINRLRAWYGFASDVGHWALMGFGAWAIEERATGAFVGRIALSHPPHFPERELGWIVFPAHQRRGYGLEAARAARAFVADALGWTTVVSYIRPGNEASIALARRLGAVIDRDARGFDPSHLVFRHSLAQALP